MVGTVGLRGSARISIHLEHTHIETYPRLVKEVPGRTSQHPRLLKEGLLNTKILPGST